MKITPGLDGENSPQVLWEEKVFADLKIGSNLSCKLVSHIEKWKS